MSTNTFITPELIATRALATLYNDTVVAALVNRDFDPAFTGKQGDTVTVRVPLVFTAKRFDRSKGIEVQNGTEDSFAVKLDQIADVSFEVTAEELLLEIGDFAEQLINPAMEAIIQQVDGDLAEELVDAANQTANPSGDYVEEQKGGGLVSGSDSTALVDARTKLGRNKLPTMNRRALFSPEGAGVLLKDERISTANKSGDTDGLREASIGRVFGFDTYESQVLGYGSGDRGGADGVAFHRDAITLATRVLPKLWARRANRPPRRPTKGSACEWSTTTPSSTRKDVVSVDFLYGTRAVRPQGAVEVSLGQGS
jgi:hypothetical protein